MKRDAFGEVSLVAGLAGMFIGLPALVVMGALGNEPPPPRPRPAPDLEISQMQTQQVIDALKRCPVLLRDVEVAMADDRIVRSELQLIRQRQYDLALDPVTSPACLAAPLVGNRP